jgi:molecular chaperone GrpE
MNKKKVTKEEAVEKPLENKNARVSKKHGCKEVEYLEDLKRLQADFENYKRRQGESQKELGGYLIEKVIRDITPVLDNFYQATSFIPEDQQNTPFITGIMYIQKQLEDALVGHGLVTITPSVDDTFDPSLHEAVAGEGEKIEKVLQPGYKLGERIIKPARVNLK